MHTEHIESKFTAMGARLKVREIPSRWQRGTRTWIEPVDYAVDIQRDRKGEFFELRVPTHLHGFVEATVLQTEPIQRHLLLLVRTKSDQPQLDRFLCGHDERDWFVAAVPGGASSVRQAMNDLQPPAVRAALFRNHISGDKRYTRKNQAFRRQGEWFFVPMPALEVEEKLILHNEPLRRGGVGPMARSLGKPHFVEQLFRTGGQPVNVCDRYPAGLSDAAYRNLLSTAPEAAGWRWQQMQRDPKAYARGTVRHSDHKTITLPCWHEVFMNTETKSRTMAKVAFLD